MANKHIRNGNYVVLIVYTHTQGTDAHLHQHMSLKLKHWREIEWKCAASKISLLSKTLYAGYSL